MTDMDGTGPEPPDFGDDEAVPAHPFGGDDDVSDAAHADPGLDDPAPIIEQDDSFDDEGSAGDPEPVPSQPAPPEPVAESPMAPEADRFDLDEPLPGLDDAVPASHPGSAPWETAEGALGDPADDLIRADADAGAPAPDAPAPSTAGDHLPGLDEADTPPWPSDAEIDLPPLPDPESNWKLVPPGNGMIGGALIAAAATAIAAASPAIHRAVSKRGPTGAADAVAALNDAGVDARLEHADLDTLERALAAATPVLLTGDGEHTAPVLHLTAVDRAAGTVSVAGDDGVNHAMSLAAFAQLWDDTARQVIVTSGDRPMVLLPIAAGMHQMAAARRPPA